MFGSEAYFRGHLERGRAVGRKRPGPPPNQELREGVQEPAERGEAERVGDPPPPRLQGQGEAVRAFHPGKDGVPGEAVAMTLAELEAAALAANLALGESTAARASGEPRAALVPSKSKHVARGMGGCSDAPSGADTPAHMRAALLAGLSPEERALVERAEEIARRKRAEEARRTAR